MALYGRALVTALPCYGALDIVVFGYRPVGPIVADERLFLLHLVGCSTNTEIPTSSFPLSRLYTTYYYTSYWTTLNIIATLKRGSDATQGH